MREAGKTNCQPHSVAAFPAFLDIGLMQQTHICEMLAERLDQRGRQHRHSILLTLAATDGDLISIEIQILHAQLQTLFQAKARSVKQHRDDPHRAFQVRQHCSHFLPTQDDRQTNRLLRSDDVLDVTDRFVEHVLVQEQQRREGLVLG